MAQRSGGHAALFQDPSSVSSIHGGQLTTPVTPDPTDIMHQKALGSRA